MGFLTSLLGSENAYLTAVIGLGIVVVLIIVGVWLLKLVSDASRTVGRGRSRRLGVVDSVMLDQKRQAILLRRDNVEHLIITGGPQDLVVEAGIAVGPAPQQQRPAPSRGSDQRSAEPRFEGRGRTIDRTPDRTPEPAPARTRAAIAAPANGRQRAALRNTGLLRPVTDGESMPSGGIGQNGLRNGADSAIADHPHYGDGDQGAADYETADMSDGERDHYPGSDDRRRE